MKVFKELHAMKVHGATVEAIIQLPRSERGTPPSLEPVPKTPSDLMQMAHEPQEIVRVQKLVCFTRILPHS